jgi:hypothetical protein
MSALEDLIYGLQNAPIKTIGSHEYYSSAISVEMQIEAASELAALRQTIAEMRQSLIDIIDLHNGDYVHPVQIIQEIARVCLATYPVPEKAEESNA